MASTPIQLTVDRGEITLDDLADAVAAFNGYLEQLDLAESSNGRRTLDFRLVSLSYNSPVHIAAVAEPREDVADNGPAVVAMAIRGILEIEAGIGRPARLSDEALDNLRRLAALSHNGKATVTLDAPSLSLSAPVTSALASQVERVLSQGDSIGAIEGQLDTISVHGHPYFTVYDALTGRGVRCYFDEGRRALVLRSLGKKMIAHGRLRRDPSGFPKELTELDHLAELGQGGGSIQGLAGIYKGLDVRRHLREVRGE
ncbi:MAG: hypothetical protein ABSD62_12640 [Candidatus Limnocylindrales bacterium]|jgi:hypothetical protein